MHKLTGMATFRLLLGVLVAVLAIGCVTTKKKKTDVGWLKKNYHNLTSKYNYWFNADELLRLTIADLSAQHKDNYNQLLELYPYAAVDPSGALGNLDNVIKKSATAIVLHRVSDFVDDCYTLMGQAQYLKRDYETAEATFRYIQEHYNPNTKSKLKQGSKKKKDLKKKKKKKKKSPKKKKKKKASSGKGSKEAQKTANATSGGKNVNRTSAGGAKSRKDDSLLEEEDPYSNFLQRTAAYPLAMIWFGRTLTERQKYEEADFLYRSLEQDPFFPVEIRKDLYTAQAYLYIKQKRFDQAIEPLERAVQQAPRKRERARLAYILSQLYERANQPDKAYQALNIALASNPDYEMEFNARLRQIQAGYAHQRFSAAEAINQLERMIRDEKNIDYKDQIYFTIAGILLREKRRDEAVAMLKRALANATSNTYLRGEAYLLLADLYFEGEDYVSAKKYYDSTLTVLPATDPRFGRVQRYADNLTEIARLITRIMENDSILRLYYMSPEERIAFAKRLQKQQKEEAKQQAATNMADNSKPTAEPPTAPTAGQRSSFYFYNDAFVKKGKKDFAKVWGNRKLEDNWRRSNRAQTFAGAEGLGPSRTDTANTNLNEDIEAILKGLPKSEEEMAVIHASTYEAMYHLGVLYRDKLAHNQRCANTLEELQRRYPDTTRFQIETWYYCYLAFNDLGNKERAKYYYDLLATKHPNSPYTRVLTDPAFLHSAREREREATRYYDQTYELFKKGDYQTALERCLKAPERYGNIHPLIPKFTLLRALCIGSLQGQAAYCGALKEVVALHPESPEATRAKEIMRVVSCDGHEVATTPAAPTAPIDDAFTLDDDKLHYFLVVLYGSDIPIDEVKIAVSDYNREHHRLEQLRLSNIYLGTDLNTPILVIRKFDNKEQAMRYYYEVKDRKDFLGETSKKTYSKEFFAITQENYRRVLKNKTLDGYREFFAQHYLK
ncbi:MAG: tetratricopeptide repeat protein [Saprospiraceae bacterium]|nr:tetratricopeptide repeat protein [Saprospiraceae bacterium]MDW8484173.1 tetratricopeptide repeat protein [Saprospiraceae bacterium]